MVEIEGTVEPRFAGVEEAFGRNFEEGAEVGAAVCVYHEGRRVVDLWGGLSEGETDRLWERGTISWMASATKGLTAVAALLLVDRGVLDLDAPIAEYWPEFAAEGKGRVTLRWLLSHRAGIAVLDAPISYEDELRHTPIADAIAAQGPNWEPGTAHGYHALTFGWAISEVIRRVTGRTVGRLFAEEIAAPLGLDLYIGLPDEEAERVATVVAPTEEELWRGLSDPAFAEFNRALGDPSSLLYRATFGGTTLTFEDINDPRFFGAEDPAGGGFGDAASLARLYAALTSEVEGVRLLRPGTVEAARSVEASGRDLVLLLRTDFGLGFLLPGGPLWPDFGARAFGQPGATGCLGFADPDSGIAFGYVPNKMAGFVEGNDERVKSLIDTTYRSLGR